MRSGLALAASLALTSAIDLIAQAPGATPVAAPPAVASRELAALGRLPEAVGGQA